MRTFVALDIEAEICRRIEDFIAEVRGLEAHARWVSADSLHVTLKFIGEKPDSMVEKVREALGGIRRPPIELSFRGTGFFPNPGSARVFWVGIEAGSGLLALQKEVEQALAGLGIEPEERAFSPHLTLARAAGGSGAPARRAGDKPGRQFARVRQALEEGPARDFGTMVARDFFLYRSQLSPKGARYTKIARYALAFEERG